MRSRLAKREIAKEIHTAELLQRELVAKLCKHFYRTLLLLLSYFT